MELSRLQTGKNIISEDLWWPRGSWKTGMARYLRACHKMTAKDTEDKAEIGWVGAQEWNPLTSARTHRNSLPVGKEEVTDICHFDEVKGYEGFNNTAASVRWCSPPQPHLQTWLLWCGSETLVLILTLTLAPKVILAKVILTLWALMLFSSLVSMRFL